jgi:hypothetical protein
VPHPCIRSAAGSGCNFNEVIQIRLWFFPLAEARGPWQFSAIVRIRLFLFALASGIALRGATALPLFNATLTVGKEHRFVLVDAAGKASTFLRLGEMFDGYTLKAYDPKTGVLELERDGKVSRVTLVADAAVGSGGAPLMPAMPATIADANSVLNKMRFEEMMERVIAQQRKAIAGNFEQMSARMVAQGADKEEVAAHQKKMMDEILSAMEPQLLKDEMAKIYSEVFTKPELDGMAAFYSTPIGEAISTKQPDVQEKLGAAIQKRMTEIMPRVQQMGREFAAQQKAKKDAAGGVAPAAPAPKQ